MELFKYLNGQGGFMILAFFVIVIVLFRKFRNYRDVKQMEKRQKNK